MTEDNFDRFLNRSKPPVTEADDDADNNSTDFKFKKFTSETNDNDTAVAAVLNTLLDENKSTHKSVAFLNRNIHELLVLLKDKKAQDRERRFYFTFYVYR